MSAGLGFGCLSYNSIHTKADAIKFAIETTAARKEDGSCEFNEKKAKKVFDFICTNVTLVDSDVVPLEQIVESVYDKVKDVLETAATKKKE